MKLLLIISLLFLAANNTVFAADASAGKTKAATCIACHGVDGNSFNPEWPSLAGQDAGYLAKQIRNFKSGERTNDLMAPMVAPLTDADIDDISAHFASQTLAEATTKEEYVALGAKIYTGGTNGVTACTACHGPTGTGLPAAGFPQVSGQKIQYVINQLNNFKSGTRSNDANGMMRDISAAMNEEQIVAIANYLAGLH